MYIVSKAAARPTSAGLRGIKGYFCSVDGRIETLLVSIDPGQWKVSFCIDISFYRSPQRNRHIIGSSTKGTSS